MSNGLEPHISVVIPTLNRLPLLNEALDSLAAQTFPDWECVVVDDGSSDGTAEEMARRHARDARCRFVVRGGGRRGANACRNAGIRASRADLIVFLDSDDLLAPHCLDRRVEAMRDNADLDYAVFDGDVFHDVVGDLRRTFDMGQRSDDLDRFLALEPPWDTSAPIWRKRTLEALGGWDEDLLSWQDIDLHIRALAAGLRYRRRHDVDHHIRWKISDDRTSRRKAYDTRLFENCEPCAAKWRRALADGGVLSAAREKALAGVVFHLAEHWAGYDVKRAWRFWGSARVFGISIPHIVCGDVFLAAMSTSVAGTTQFRGLLRRWKALARIMAPALPDA